MGLGFFLKTFKELYMKRIFTLLFLSSSLMATSALAQGFYHVRNHATGRYMIMTDNQKGTSSEKTGADLTAVETSKNIEKVFTHPGAILYLTSLSGKSDVYSQNSSIGQLSGGKLYPYLTAIGDGTYTIHGSYSTYVVYLGDQEKPGKDDAKLADLTAGKDRTYWELLPIDNSATGQFIGIKPTVQTADGKYWGTILCGFEFTLQSDGMKAYYVDEVSDTEFNLKEITSKKVPAHVPVIIECASDDYSKNIIRPTSKDGAKDASAKLGNKLGGVYFDRGDNTHDSGTSYNATTMRVIGIDDNKNLIFRKATNDDLTVYEDKGKYYLPHNKAYLGVSSSAADVLHVKGSSGIETISTEVAPVKEGTYTLSGQRVADEPTRPGIYIRNGKKIIIK